MCGPIVASFSFNLKEKNKTLPHLFYNSGRLTTYMLLGGVIGATGSVTKTVSQIANLQNMVMIALGMMIIVMGFGMTGYLSRLNIFREGFYPKGMISKGFGRLRAIQSPFIYYPIGLLLGFLPCGSIYTALLIAARAGMETNSPWEGFFMGVGLMFFSDWGRFPPFFLSPNSLISVGSKQGISSTNSGRSLWSLPAFILLSGEFVFRFFCTYK